MKENEQPRVTDELIRETDGFWNDPKKVLLLIDLIFLFDDGHGQLPS